MAGPARASSTKSSVFAAISDPTRRAILDRLKQGGAPVNEIASAFDVTRPAISKHLRLLREAQLVRERKEGRQRIYELTPQPLREVADWAEGYRAFWASNLLALKKHVESKQGGKKK